MSQKSAERGCERQPDCRLDLRLVDAFDLIFYWIFDGQNLARCIVKHPKHGRQSSCFAAACGTSDDDHAMWQCQQALNLRVIGARHPKLADLEQSSVLGEEPQYR